MLLTDELLLHYKRCQRRAFLDWYGDRTQQNPSPDFLLKLRQDSLIHKQEILQTLEKDTLKAGAQEFAPLSSPQYLTSGSSLHTLLPTSIPLITCCTPKYPKEDWAVGARATEALMQQGIDCIIHPVLLAHNEEEITLLSCPALLIKQPGRSQFGDWVYVPVDIRFGKRPKADYQIVAAFHSQLVAAVQGVWPSAAWLILRRQCAYSVNLDRWMPIMMEMLADCIDTIQFRQEPEVFISRQKCSLCHWYSSCYAIAQSQQHISLLPGVSPNRYRELLNLGITTVQSLSQAEMATLEPVFGGDIAWELIQQAQATVHNRAIRRQHPNPTVLGGQASVPRGDEGSTRLTTQFTPLNPAPSLSCPSTVELFFDIEAQPELNLDYLLGLLVIDQSTQRERFYPLLAENPQDEAAIWQQFLDVVGLYPHAPIFHFSSYEVETVKRLAKLYGTPLEQFKPLLSRFVDVHEQVMTTVWLPVESYSLKHLARWLGFEWRDGAITGSQCVCLYDQWLATGDRSLLEVIQRYNEDDCRATYLLKDWLWSFLQEKDFL